MFDLTLERMSSSRTRAVLIAPALAMLGAGWVLTHPYEGIIGDGLLYTAQGLLRLEPEVFSHDLFFAGGSQDAFTVFGTLYSWLIRAIGVSAASMTVYAIGQSTWFSASLLALRQLLPHRHRLIAIAFLMCVPTVYGIGGVGFKTAEGYATARLAAEGLALISVALALRRRRLALLVAALALPVHPLMAVGPLLVVLVLLGHDHFLNLQRKAFWWGIVAALLMLALAFAGSPLLPRMDNEWFEWVRYRSPQVVPDAWRPHEWSGLILPVLWFEAVRRIESDGRLKTLWLACGLTCGGSVVLCVVAALSHWALMIQAQPWRLEWLPLALAPVALMRARLTGRFGHRATPHLLVAALLSCVFGREFVFEAGTWCSMLTAALLLASLFCSTLQGRIAHRLSVLAIAINGTFALIWALMKGAALALVHAEAGNTIAAGLLVGAGALTWVFLPFIAWTLTNPTIHRAHRGIMWIGLLGAVVLAAKASDARRPVDRFIESLVDDGIPEWQARIPRSATVYWQLGQGSAAYCWLVLHRACYLSAEQVSGLVFSRWTAAEAYRRVAFTDGVGLSRRQFDLHRNPVPRWQLAPPTPIGLQRLCSDRIVDFAVLDRPLLKGGVTKFLETPTGQSFYLHDCRDVR